MKTRSGLKISYEEITAHACRTYSHKKCSLCPYIESDYRDELQAKQNKLQMLLDKCPGGKRIEPIIPSPQSRHYRTGTKRRMYYIQKNPILALSGGAASSGRPYDVMYCPIEPHNHNRIYQIAREFLKYGGCTELCKSLNYIIVKGGYDAYMILFSLKYYNGKINQKLNELSKILTFELTGVSGLYIILDDDTGYYISDKVHTTPKNIRKIYGGAGVTLSVHGKKYFFSPLVFSQTNTSVLDDFTEAAVRLLNPGTKDHVLDLYCGYGLFGLLMSDYAASVTGLELLSEAVRCARYNAKINHAENTRWMAAPVTKDSIQRVLASGKSPSLLVLDPPRNGTEPGVIQALALNPFRKVLHIFCNTEILVTELLLWNKAGYRTEKIIPVDMFPATEHLEVMVLLTK